MFEFENFHIIRCILKLVLKNIEFSFWGSCLKSESFFFLLVMILGYSVCMILQYLNVQLNSEV